MTQLNVGVDIEALQDLVIAGGFFLEGGAVDFAQWSARMVGQLGKDVKPHLRNVWDQARTSLGQQRRQGISETLRLGVGTDLQAMHTSVRALAEEFVAEGITEFDTLTDAVPLEQHGMLSQGMDVLPFQAKTTSR